METAVAALLLVVASVVFACTVVTYAIATVEQTINTQNMPQIGELKTLVNQLLNQTNVANNSLPTLPSSTP